MPIQKDLASLSDDELIASLKRWIEMNRKSASVIVAHLIEVEDRELHLAMGYGSLFAYATEGLGFSAACAYKRMRAARLARQFPQVLAHLESGELSLSTVAVLSPCRDAPDAATLIESARGCSRQEVEQQVRARH